MCCACCWPAYDWRKKAVLYQISGFSPPASERGVRWNVPACVIGWPEAVRVIRFLIIAGRAAHQNGPAILRGARYTGYPVRTAWRAAPYRNMRPLRPIRENTLRKKAPASFDAGASS